ncbi:MAG: histidine kinase dimerization/phospho-acceptor domain-containing protein [Cyanobacteria bacterium J06639_16]
MDDEQTRSLQLAYRQALDLAQFKAGFLARTSHELRSPLNRLISLNQLILSDLCDDPQEEREFIAEGNKAALELLKLLDQLIDISKIDIGRAVPQVYEQTMAEIFLELESRVGLQVADRGMKLAIDNPDPQVQVWGDASWIVRALTGLVELAVEAAQTGSVRLKVTIHDAEQQVELTLADDRPLRKWETLIKDLQTLSPEEILNPTPFPLELASHPDEPSTVTLPAANPHTHPSQLSPTLRLFIAKQTLEATGASFEIIAPATTDPVTNDPATLPSVTVPQAASPYSLRCRFPMATPPSPGAPIETAPSPSPND